MTWDEKRKPYEFSNSVKRTALEKSNYTCDNCGRHRSNDVRLQVHHKLPIEAVIKQFTFISHVIISHLVNTQILCTECHKELHSDIDRTDWRMLAVALMQEYQEFTVNLIGRVKTV